MSTAASGSCKKRSVARELTLALILTVAVISVTTVFMAYFASLRNSKAQLEAKADEYIGSIASFVELPLWNMEEDSVKKIGGAYAQNLLVCELIVTDGAGK